MLNGSADVGPRDFSLDDMVPEGERSKISQRIGVGDLVRMEWDYFECFVGALEPVLQWDARKHAEMNDVETID
jgi:hypothetical protein